MLPDVLTHYYREHPFRTLSDLSTEAAAKVVAELQRARTVPRRLFHPEYLHRRREIEQIVRRMFVELGGRPRRTNPHYAVVGRSPTWETLEPRSLEIPLSLVPPERISFTFSDSYYTFADATLGGRAIPDRPHRRTVFRLDQLEAAVSRFGWPAGYQDASEPFDVYVEAQIWDDEALAGYQNEWDGTGYEHR